MAQRAPPDSGSPPGLNPDLKRSVDRTYSDSQHGSDPMATVSVKRTGPAVWPIIWAVVVIAMVLLAFWFLL